MKHEILFLDTSARVIVDETITLADMMRDYPQFFKNSDGSRKTHGEKETYKVYRGQLIVSNTNEFAGKSVRRTVVYVFIVESLDDGVNAPSTFCISQDVIDVKSATKLIDAFLEAKKYRYGLYSDDTGY